MNLNLVRVAVLLDRSESIRTNNLVVPMVNGFNEFVGELRSQPGDVNLKLVQFDSVSYDVVFDRSLNNIPHMTSEMLQPRGRTPLIDAQARAIIELGQELASMSEHDRPGKVFLMTMTDGEENASTKYSTQQVLEMIRVQRDVYKWSFAYCGANQDAFKVADALGIPQDAVLKYTGTPTAVRNTYSSMGRAVNQVRSAVSRGNLGAALAFDDDDRVNAMAPDPVPEHASR